MNNALVPEFAVSDWQASKEFYCNILGFSCDYERPEEGFCYLSLDGAELMIDQIGTGRTFADGHLPRSYPFGRGAERPNSGCLSRRPGPSIDRQGNRALPPPSKNAGIEGVTKRSAIASSWSRIPTDTCYGSMSLWGAAPELHEAASHLGPLKRSSAGPYVAVVRCRPEESAPNPSADQHQNRSKNNREKEIWCPQRDSNSRPTDYKSAALPTEL